MGIVFGYPQPQLNIDMLYQGFQVQEDDPMLQLEREDLLIPYDYFVVHGISSGGAQYMLLKCQTEKGRLVQLPTKIYEGPGCSTDPKNIYFECLIFKDKRARSQYGMYRNGETGQRETYNVKLTPTHRLKHISYHSQAFS